MADDRRGSLRRARLRVAAFGVLVGALAAAAALSGALPSAGEVRHFGASLGWLGYALWVPATAVLNALFVPGPVLAGAAGLMFGTALGTPIALLAATLTATAELLIARYVAGARVGSLLPDRARRIDAFLERRGFWAVLYVRLAPGIPYTLSNYGAGLTALRFRQMAAGTAIGAAPRTFAWVALGGSIDDLGSPESVAALVVLVAIALVGLVLARRQLATQRRGAS
jgi:uncharacterized membrane protein YdjX (TVP38/TMEM64 family)